MLRKIDVPFLATGVDFRESRQEGSCSEDPGFIKVNGVRRGHTEDGEARRLNSASSGRHSQPWGILPQALQK